MGNNSYIFKVASAVMFIISLGFYVRDFNWMIPFAIAFVLFGFAIDDMRKKK